MGHQPVVPIRRRVVGEIALAASERVDGEHYEPICEMLDAGNQHNRRPGALPVVRQPDAVDRLDHAFLLMTLPMCIAEVFETVEPDTSRVFGHDR